MGVVYLVSADEWSILTSNIISHAKQDVNQKCILFCFGFSLKAY